MRREQVINMAFYVCTLEECLAAEAAVTEWLREHPQDLSIYELCSQLGIMTLAAQQAAQKSAA